jgi:SAM-dependent methyltransferase
MSNIEWGNNAKLRYSQVLTGEDITFSNVFVPYWIKYFEENKFRNVLEIGCGPGVLSSEIAKFVDDLTCVEKDKTMAKIAQLHNDKISNVNIIETDIENFKSSEVFDGCFAHMVIHNVDNLLNLLQSVKSLIINRGEFTFSIPHPCFYHFYKNEELVDLDYMKESRNEIDFVISKDKSPLPCKITYYHRNIEAYTKALVKAGFLIKEINEIYPTNEVMDKYPLKWIYPRYIVFRAIKID